MRAVPGMSVSDVLLAPWRIPVRVVRALDDLAALADRARRDPDPVDVVRERLDALLLELAAAVVAIQDATGAAIRVDATGHMIHDGGQDLLEATERVDQRGRQIVDGGARLTEVSQELERHMRVFRAALPRLLEGLDTVEELEDAVETVADTVEPLQGAAQRVGRVTQRF